MHVNAKAIDSQNLRITTSIPGMHLHISDNVDAVFVDRETLHSSMLVSEGNVLTSLSSISSYLTGGIDNKFHLAHMFPASHVLYSPPAPPTNDATVFRNPGD